MIFLCGVGKFHSLLTVKICKRTKLCHNFHCCLMQTWFLYIASSCGIAKTSNLTSDVRNVQWLKIAKLATPSPPSMGVRVLHLHNSFGVATNGHELSCGIHERGVAEVNNEKEGSGLYLAKRKVITNFLHCYDDNPAPFILQDLGRRWDGVHWLRRSFSLWPTTQTSLLKE